MADHSLSVQGAQVEGRWVVAVVASLPHTRVSGTLPCMAPNQFAPRLFKGKA